MFMLVTTAMLAIASLSAKVLLRGKAQVKDLLRRVTSRGRGRSELSWFSAIMLLLTQDLTLLDSLSPHILFDLSARLPNVSCIQPLNTREIN